MARILVVDDDLLIRAAIHLWLTDKGHEVVLVESGSAGLNALDETAFDVMVVDIFMPGMDGFESIRSFRKCAPGVPIIAMSGVTFRERQGSAPDFLRMAGTFGAASFLRKPFKPADLHEAIDACLAARKSETPRM